MTRVDVPTLECDRCAVQTQVAREMANYKTLTHYHMSGQTTWDLCPECWVRFAAFVSEVQE